MSAQGTSHPADLAEVLAPSTRGRPRRLLLGLLGLLALGLIALAVIGGLSSSTAGVQFKTQPVIRGELRVQVTATGTLEPVNQVEVGTEVSGTIEAVLVDYNDRVRKGDVLARFDTAQLEPRFRQSEAALALARARVQDAEATLIQTGNKLRRSQDLIG
jgi:HlyD family secretion protein